MTIEQRSGGIVASFPRKRIGDQVNECERSYRIQQTKKSGVFIKEPVGEAFIEIPLYAARIAVWADIFYCLQELKYDLRFLRLIKQDGSDISESYDFFSLLPKLRRKAERDLESSLTELFIEAYTANFNPFYQELADKQQVGEGYKHLASFFSRNVNER